jgi:hypothetical protein
MGGQGELDDASMPATISVADLFRELQETNR